MHPAAYNRHFNADRIIDPFDQPMRSAPLYELIYGIVRGHTRKYPPLGGIRAELCGKNLCLSFRTIRMIILIFYIVNVRERENGSVCYSLCRAIRRLALNFNETARAAIRITGRVNFVPHDTRGA